MSWIDKELKRRAEASKRSAATESAPAASASDRMQELWSKLERANAALPSELQLRLEPGGIETIPTSNSVEEVTFVAWLRARNGAGLGFTGEAVRYYWPKTSRRISNNFWIRWNAERQRYQLSRRVGSFSPAIVASRAFNDARTDHMIKCLVLGRRIKPWSVRRKRFGLF